MIVITYKILSLYSISFPKKSTRNIYIFIDACVYKSMLYKYTYNLL